MNALSDRPGRDLRLERESQLVDFIRRFKRNRGAVIGVGIVAIYLTTAIVGPVVIAYDPLTGSLAERIQPPSWSHPFGTDEIGRDVLSRIIIGARISLYIMMSAISLGLSVGVTLGVLAGFFGGIIDNVVMRVVDIMLAFPSIFLAMTVIAILRPGLMSVIVASGVYCVPQFARIARGSVLSLKEREFIEAARAAGESDLAIMLYYILPNALAPLVVNTTLQMASVLLTAAGLSFLGLGVQPPAPEWGAMLAKGRDYVLVAPHVATFPGLAIFAVCIGCNLMGDGLRDSLDPRLKD